MKDRLLGWFPVRALRRYLDARGGTWAKVIAWNAFFAFFPIVLITVTVLGIVLQNPGLKSNVETQVVQAFPECRGEHGCAVLSALDAFRQRTGLLGAVAFVGLLWSGSALFGAIDQALASLYPGTPRSFIRQKLMGFGMILLFTVTAVPLLLSSSLLSLLESLPATPQFFRTGPAALLIQIAAGVLDATVLFTTIYYVVPSRRQTLRRVLPGALVAGTLFECFSLIFPLYFKLAGGFATWGQTFALVFVLLFYFYVLGQIIMLGGAVDAELDPDLGDCRAGAGVASGGLGGEAAAQDPTLAPGEARVRRRRQVGAGRG